MTNSQGELICFLFQGVGRMESERKAYNLFSFSRMKMSWHLTGSSWPNPKSCFRQKVRVYLVLYPSEATQHPLQKNPLNSAPFFLNHCFLDLYTLSLSSAFQKYIP